MNKIIIKGLKFSIFNFIIVALLGTIMRYKIAFSFPFLDQKHLQEAHSHFAFYGWITSCIYMLIFRYLTKINVHIKMRKYYILIGLNFFASFGLLFAFLYGGYFWLSIAFSTMALLISFFYFYFLIKDLKGYKENSKIWFLGGLFFAVFSSIGVFTLSYMMVANLLNPDFYLALTYFFLHYQYNGFFIFSCIGLLLFSLKESGISVSEKENRLIFYLLFIGCFVGYGLSILWAKLPMWFFILIIIATLLQTYGAIRLYLLVKKNWKVLTTQFTPLQRFVLFYVGVAFAAKIALQLGSNIPMVSQFAFGFRNIVIAYLHLVLLMCVATFLLNQILISGHFSITAKTNTGLKLFLLGVFLNEAVLGLMGVFSINYVAIPFANEILFGVSLLILLSITIIYLSLRFQKPRNHFLN